ncbi:hypothetical protein BDZ91DRAFT_791648 [Kalaharituber pfeilii]|nr:hypothetical protein BDZ91DRAFT_791648 [Kalaharituber pfeilii]
MHNTINETNTIIKEHDEENTVIERHDKESSIVERHGEVEAHNKSVPGLTSDEPSPRIITLNDDENTNADKRHPPPVDFELARLHILNCLAEAYRKHDQTLALPDSTNEPTKKL